MTRKDLCQNGSHSGKGRRPHAGVLLAKYVCMVAYLSTYFVVSSELLYIKVIIVKDETPEVKPYIPKDP